MIANLVLSLVATFALVATRMAGFVVTSPFPGPWAPTQVKVGLVLVVSAAMTPSAPPSGAALDLAILPLALGELVVGLATGFVLRLALAAADVVGAQIAQSLGLSFAASYDPSLAASADPLTKLVSHVATVIALAAGGHRIVLGALLGSIRALPPGSAPDASAMTPEVVAWLARSFDVGVTLAMPATAVCLASQLALAFVARAAPSLNVFQIGLPVTLAAGFGAAAVAAPDVGAGLAEHFGALREAASHVLSSPRP